MEFCGEGRDEMEMKLVDRDFFGSRINGEREESEKEGKKDAI